MVSVALVRLVQVAASAWTWLSEVMTSSRLPVVEKATATNWPAPNATPSQPSSIESVRLVQVIPSGLVITRLPLPELATATNRPAPHVTEFQVLLAAAVRAVQVMPSALVMTQFEVHETPATAANMPFELKATEVQLLSAALVRAVQVAPSGLVITRLPVPELPTATNRPLPYV